MVENDNNSEQRINNYKNIIYKWEQLIISLLVNLIYTEGMTTGEIFGFSPRRFKGDPEEIHGSIPERGYLWFPPQFILSLLR